MGVAKPRKDGARACKANRLDQLTTQQAKGHRIQQQHTLVRKMQDAAVRVELQQFLQVEIAGTNGSSSHIERPISRDDRLGARQRFRTRIP